MSGIVVLQDTRGKTLSSAWLQILGTLVGAIISAAYLSLLPFNAIGMAAAVFATVLLCYALRIPEHSRLAALAVLLWPRIHQSRRIELTGPIPARVVV